MKVRSWAMAKIKSMFFCQECGFDSPKWLGRCPGCGAWNSMREEIVSQNKKSKQTSFSQHASPKSITSVDVEPLPRFSSGMEEVDRVLGGGIVPGSLLLLGGDPGIGKSTLSLQIALLVANNHKKVLYVSGEESSAQIRMRADRIGNLSDSLMLFASTELEVVLKEAEEMKPDLLIIDSIQTLYLSELASAPGSVSQVRESTGRLLRFSKENTISTLIIGHVTKEGAIAGPKLLEHMVDGVLYFEGDKNNLFRVLRAIKNRFGGIYETGIFRMNNNGLEVVENPSALLLSERPAHTSGSTIFGSIEGSRPLMLEIQALVSKSNYAVSRRTTAGFDTGRLALLSAVIEKRLAIPLSTQDIYINIVGGLAAQEPAADLAVVASLLSSFQSKALDSQLVIFGEVGLTGEVRSVSQIDLRIKEAMKLGFKNFCIPKGNMKDVKNIPNDGSYYGIMYIKELLQLLK